MQRMTTPQRCCSLTEACQQLGISKGLLRQEIVAGRLRVAKAGRRVLVPLGAIDQWLAGAMTPSVERVDAPAEPPHV